MDVECRRCGQRKPSLETPPLAGKWGPVVLSQTCADCWHEWVDEQTRVINHERLLPSNPEHRSVLYDRMTTFLKLQLS